MARPPLPSSLGLPVTTRDYSLLELVSRAWGSEFRAPDHGVYVFASRRFDSTDMGVTGFYGRGVFTLLLDENRSAINDETGAYVYSDP